MDETAHNGFETGAAGPKFPGLEGNSPRQGCPREKPREKVLPLSSGPFADVFGFFNAAIGNTASVSGGEQNTASGDVSSVSGGQNNTASGVGSSVSGGQYNTASADLSSILGGERNSASGTSSSILGGNGNTVTTTDGTSP
jgi:hypothetical protein